MIDRFSRARTFGLVGLGVIVAAYLWLARRLSIRLDDAYIILRYARNLAEGAGMVFNPGERVEGHTCFLWVVVLAGARLLGAELSPWARVLSALAGAGVPVLVYAAARRLACAQATSLAAGAAVALSPAFAFWAGTGMETVPLTLLMALAVFSYVRKPEGLLTPFVLGLAALMRPDALALAAAVAVERCLAWRAGPAFWRWCAVFAAIVVPHHVWRVAYYGRLLPNTYYAKVGGGWDDYRRGWDYVLFSLGEAGFVWLALAALAVALAPSRRVLAIAAAVALSMVQFVVVGGDFFPLHRFLIPVLPLYAVLAAAGMQALFDRGGRGLGVAAAVVCSLALAPVWRDQLSLARFPGTSAWTLGLAVAAKPAGAPSGETAAANPVMTRMPELLDFLRRTTEPGDTVAAVAIGEIGYHVDVRVLDLVGLVDAHIAGRDAPRFGRGFPGHEKFDSAYVLAQEPRFIVMSGPPNAPGSPIPAERDLWFNPQFRQRYAWDGLLYRRQ